MKKVIITGANGFIGSSLVKRMISGNVEVVAVDVTFTGERLPSSGLITRIESPVDATLTEKIPAGDYDAFYNFAWRGVNGPDKANPAVQLSNIQMAVDCADICKKLSVKKYLCAGTVAENAICSLAKLESTPAGMMYGVSKYACRLIVEDYCKNIGQKFVWMQFANIYGVGNKTGNLVSYTLSELMNGKKATFGPAQQPYDFIYVDDLIEAVYRMGACDTLKTFYYIGSGDPHILREYLVRIGELIGCAENVRIGIRPDDGIKYSMDMFDSADTVNAIGNYAVTGFDEGIEKTIDWLKNC